MFKDSNPKIDFYFQGDYLFSTQWSRTCKEARRKYKESLEYKGEYYRTRTENYILNNWQYIKTRIDKRTRGE